MTAEDDKNALLNAVLPFSVEAIEEHGEFFPHGATMTSEGEIRTAMVDTGEEDDPDPEDVMSTLVEAFRGEAAEGKLRATAIASNVTVSREDEEPKDAILVLVEHPGDDPVAIAVFLPYSRDGEDAEWEFGELEAQQAEASVFGGTVNGTGA